MPPRITSPGRLPSSVSAAAFLNAADRARLRDDRAELFVVAAVVDEVGHDGYGPQSIVWLRGPWRDDERVLSLNATPFRRRQVAGLRDALRRSDAVGPFVLTMRRTEAGHEAWALVAADDDGAQLALDQDGSGK